MRRFAGILLGDWPLKLGAVALATVLYGGVVLSESTRAWPGQVPIAILNPPQDAAVLTVLEPVTAIQYRAPLDVASQLTSGSFRASIDLARVEPQPGGSSLRLPVELVAVDGDVEVVAYSPRTVLVDIDPVTSREIPVTVDDGVIPEGIRVGAPVVEPRSVTLRGASSRVMSVRTATARVTVDASAINVDQEVDILPLDETGVLVPGVVAEPARTRVRIEVARQLAFATLPVVPRLTGEVAPGFELRSIDTVPLSVTVSGEEPQVTALAAVETEPIDVTGLTGDVEMEVRLAIAEELTVTGGDTVSVRLRIVPVDGTRTFEAGLILAGGQPDRQYLLSSPSVLVTLSGSVPILDALVAAGLTGTIDVTDLDAGSHEVGIVVDAPEDTELVAISPETVLVDISITPDAASPAPGEPPASVGPQPSEGSSRPSAPP